MLNIQFKGELIELVSIDQEPYSTVRMVKDQFQKKKKKQILFSASDTKNKFKFTQLNFFCKSNMVPGQSRKASLIYLSMSLS